MTLNFKEIKTVILAGGKGTRLYPLSINKPKPMILLEGKPLLHHILNHSTNQGFTQFLFKTGYCSEQIEQYFGDGKNFDCNIEYLIEKEPLGTAGGLKYLEKETNPIIILYGDILLNLDLKKLINFHLKNKSQATLVVHHSNHPEDSDVVMIDEKNRIAQIVHKPGNLKFGNITNAAMYILNPECFSLIPDTNYDFGKELLPQLIKEKFKVFGYYTNEYLKDVGTIQRYEEAQNDLKLGKHINPTVKRYNLSIIIPAYKEENRIERCIKESLFFFRNNEKVNKFEIIFVADQCGDNTINIIKRYLPENEELILIINDHREQKGGSVKKGVIAARQELILFYDVDLSTPLYEINNFLNQIDDYDLLIGSRGMKESKIEKKWFKILLSKGFSILKKLSLGLEFKDTQCGFKMFKETGKILFEKQTINSSAFDVEILFLAKKYGFKIKEIPITWIDSDMSNFNTSNVIIKFLKDVTKIKRNEFKGKYKLKV